jgi:curved DNA-binding protein
MPSDSPSFVDYYKILEVNPNCSARSLEAAYHSLAKRHHPDHAADADIGKLTEVINAYKLLKDEMKRAEYDVLYARMTGFVFTAEPDLEEERTAISDAEAHARILNLLYQKRRESAQDAGVGHYSLQELLGCSDELFQFHVWYLREKGFILTTDLGTLAITIAGVDHVIATSRAVVKEKLMISQSSLSEPDGVT